MNLTVFGGTGRTGRLLVAEALASGHQVAVLARNPAKLNLEHAALRILQGDLLDSDQVSAVVAGADAVLSVLGPTSNQPVFAVSKGMASILTAMETHGVRRLVMSAGAGVRDPRDRPGPFDKGIGALLGWVSANVVEDMKRTIALVRASDRDWTIVRVPMLTDRPASGNVRVGYLGQGVGVRLSRADMAAFMLKQVNDSTYLCQAPAISN